MEPTKAYTIGDGDQSLNVFVLADINTTWAILRFRDDPRTIWIVPEMVAAAVCGMLEDVEMDEAVQ